MYGGSLSHFHSHSHCQSMQVIVGHNTHVSVFVESMVACFNSVCGENVYFHAGHSYFEEFVLCCVVL